MRNAIEAGIQTRAETVAETMAKVAEVTAKVAAKVAKVMAAALIAGAAAAQAGPDLEKYNKSCAICHNQGVAGAPKTGDAAAWDSRTAKGMDALMASVKNGLNAMPPMGMCFDCTDEEYVALIEYMAAAPE